MKEIKVDPDIMDYMMDSIIKQVILHDDGVPLSDFYNVIITDGSRELRRDPYEIMECYFEPQRVTIREDDDYKSYLWTDHKIVNMGVMQGYQDGEMLKDNLDMFKKHLVLRW